MYDERLVRAAQEGDEAAFAALYDRSIESVYDLCWALTGDAAEAARLVEEAFSAAAQNLGALTDPSQVRPWLLAIAGDRALADDEEGVLVSGWASEPSDDSTEPLGQVALRKWAADAAAVLALPDQLALELQLRHDLEGDQLASAIGCAPDQLDGLLTRVDREAEMVLSALVLARQGRRNCPDLATLLSGWDGRPSVEVAELVDNHSKTCTKCSRRRKLVEPLELVAEAPIVPAPAGLRMTVLDSVADQLASLAALAALAPAAAPGATTAVAATTALPAATSSTRIVSSVAGVATMEDDGMRRIPVVALVAVGAVIALIVAVVLALNLGGAKKNNSLTVGPGTTATSTPVVAPPATLVPIDTTTSTTLAAGSVLALNTSRVDLGSTATTAQVVLSESATASANWSASSSATWLTVSPAAGALTSGQSVRITFIVNRLKAPNPSFAANVTFAGSDTGAQSATVTLVGANAAVPTTTSTSTTSTTTGSAGGPAIDSVSATPLTSPCVVRTQSAVVTASVSDPGGTPTVVLSYSLPGQGPQSEPMNENLGGEWTGSIPLSTKAGAVSYKVTATDNNVSVSRSGSVEVTGCS